jgi:hypothetical protein
MRISLLLPTAMLLASASVAAAQSKDSVPESMPPLETAKTITVPVPDFDLTYRFEGQYADDGLDKDARNDRASTTLALRDFHLGLSGRLDSQLEYRVLANLVGADGPRFDVGYLKWSAQSKRWSLSFGLQRILVYGFEAREHDALTVITSLGFDQKPFEYAPAVGASYDTGSAGALTVQIVQDVLIAGGWNADHNATPQTATTLEWAPDTLDVGSGKLQPLVQAASYDMGHSKILGAGVQYRDAGLVVTADYTRDTFGAKGQETDSSGNTKAKNDENVKSTTAVSVSADLASVAPFAHFSIYNFADHTEAGVDEPKANAATTAYNDNGKVMGAGLYIKTMSAKVRPYLAYVRRSGNFLNTSGDEEEMSESFYKVGLAGSF